MNSCLGNGVLALLGDKWSLIIIRDIMFANRRHFERLLSKSYEGIPSNILANRLKKLIDLGMVVRDEDSTRKQKSVISLTEQSIQLVPIMVQIGSWGHQHCPASGEFRGRFRTIAHGGPRRQRAFMQDLRRRHLKGVAEQTDRHPIDSNLKRERKPAIRHYERKSPTMLLQL